MTAKPIIFSAPMVRAIFDGRKTMTRRILSNRNTYFNGSPWPKKVSFDDCDWATAWVDGGPSPAGNPGPYIHVKWPYGLLCDGGTDEVSGARVYPLVSPGDTLWVREVWAPVSPDENRRPIEECGIEYRADTPNAKRAGGWDEEPNDLDAIRWRSPIHMPRWASRLTLKVTAVKVERVQDISEADAKAESAPDYTMLPGDEAANPWVAAISFEIANK